MTYIEFFDKTAPENLCASLASPPDRVILIGDKGKVLRENARRYRDLFLARGHDVEFLTKTISRSDMGSILEALTELLERYDDCAFDLTGGDELYLVAVGMLAERFREKNIQMHRFNIQRGAIQDCDQDGRTIWEGAAPELTVEENIRIYGGDILYDSIREGATHRWEMDTDFCSDILAMWDICCPDPRAWNSQINVLAALAELGAQEENPMKAEASVKELENATNRKGLRFLFSNSVMGQLMDRGLLRECVFDAGMLSVTFKNDQVKRCLTKAGQVLEMIVYLMSLEAREEDGSYTYCDAMTGVCIDWDGRIHPQGGAYDTENEVDVVLMHGMVPVFVSCKNGTVGIDELYKLNTVADRFGGRYAKKVLIATCLESNSSFDEYFRQRAADMKIDLVEEPQNMTGEELRRTMKNLWTA